ncbi:periplasmic binding family protein [Clostridium argentinense CDC 2741]|uniref:Periplasmic binding family protein n=1 Tax=Clostridium argentinense CDC 2741 TaxID=1418104 RepID=A0A0C1U4V9_9CLOT|nr:iron-siderophore ABC transporter substrate-binding protein [Clostridium argentinense]ARC86389.1 iron siderophore-binding protein [Clostridium argentinense]KIE46718.1 periplasmic binding family protein [Clostridium argentinense CDC 2741]NFF37848.1 iron-siderophore ABC transporter substrate-binding protein [Clostridium argentinense]NFP49920.1 iron-siderophore ABC transporter substrate-binding protein [Clostridium argentinense]NFP71240.1 iron-siderophore ABC transporter substrate-binding prote
MQKKLLFAILSSMLIVSLLIGCSNKTENTSENATDSKTISIQHAMGTSEIPENPKKIVILTNEGVEAFLALGVKPVGAVTGVTGDWYEHTKNELIEVKPVGKEKAPNVEAIAALKPDLIIGNKMRHEKIYDQLSAIAPTVYSDTIRGAWKDNFKFYAKVLNKESEGEKAIQAYESKIASIKETYSDKLNNEISLVRFMDGKTRIYLGDTFSGTIFKEIGFKRPAAQQGTEFVNEIGKERLNEAEGDVMFYFTYELGDGKGLAREEEWLNDPMFKSLNVVKNNKAYKVDDTIWNTAGGIKAANLMIDDLTNMLKEGKI